MPGPTSSESASTVRVSSPLNPSSPTMASITRPRGHSTSTIRELPTSPTTTSASSSPLSRVTSTPVSSDDLFVSSFRSRSRSRSPGQPRAKSRDSAEESWHLPWRDPPKRKQSIPEDQKESWLTTRKHVQQAALSVLGTTADVAHELLSMSVDYLDFVPIPGLQPAARTLLQIWDCLELVDMNRQQCLRLTGRCADILLSVREEIKEAGDLVEEELARPIKKLNEAFNNVLALLKQQSDRPWLQRYLKRDEILRQIQGCDGALSGALGQFSLSIQVRILRIVQEAEERRQRDTKMILDSIIRSRSSSDASRENGNALQLTARGDILGLPASSSHQSLSDSASTIIPSLPVPFGPAAPALQVHQRSTTVVPMSSTATVMPGSVSANANILSTLDSLRDKQNTEDILKDMADLRALMKNALLTGSDVEMLEVLGVKRTDMPEAIKTLQRALEKCVEEDVEEVAVAAADAPVVPVVQEEESAARKRKAPSTGGLVKMVRRLSVQSSSKSASKAVPSASQPLQRSRTVNSQTSGSGSGSSGEKRRSPVTKDTLDREFLENGIDALRRLSRGAEGTMNLPAWTITSYEVEREAKIGVGFFSYVYRGKWKGRTVAIKVLNEYTPRDLFIREVEIWETLRHPHVLELFGASSGSSDPPWFFVSAYAKNGSLNEFLRVLGPEVHALVSSDSRFRTGSLPSWGGGGMGSLVGLANSNASTSGTRESWNGTGSRGSWQAGSGPGQRGSWHGAAAPEAGGVQRVRSGSVGSEIAKEWDLLRFMYEVASGMDYLHGKGVLHGDLKASNVLVTERIHCVISDFGQSEMRSEAYRISGTQPPHGTLRWQAPELMRGMSQLTTEMDVYSFSILCIEILSMGRMPWMLLDDDNVRHFVLRENARPSFPPTRFTTPALEKLLRDCWDHDPSVRPPFSKVLVELKKLRRTTGEKSVDVPSPRIPQAEDLDDTPSRPSPDLRPIWLPAFTGSVPASLAPVEEDFHPRATSPGSDAGSFRTARDTSHSPPMTSILSYPEETVPTTGIQMPEPIFFHPSGPPSSKASSLFTSTPTTQSEEEYAGAFEYPGYDSPPAVDERIPGSRDERRYRMLLSHEYHPSLTLPLWTPTLVQVGAVGYLSKPKGQFITLFNSIEPSKAADRMVRSFPSISGYGKVDVAEYRQERRSATQRGIDMIAGFLTFKTRSPHGSLQKNVSRRHSFPLKAGHKAAYMYTETTDYHYMDNLDAAKTWFKTNVDVILQMYGSEHHISKEDLFLVVGTLNAADYGLFVSHNHPDGQAHFNVFSSQNKGQPWGRFTTDTDLSAEYTGIGPVYHEPIHDSTVTSSKISNAGDPKVSVLLARLRFKPDVLDPTSL